MEGLRNVFEDSYKELIIANCNGNFIFKILFFIREIIINLLNFEIGPTNIYTDC